ncbi:MAG: relaxase/mobilization nuclease domain-containing protein [Acidiphilium sp.]|jgi:hypothetical protein|nr:relaxase/mobilization nuclease domain-containing protein [Acidiphilium sp.]
MIPKNISARGGGKRANGAAVFNRVAKYIEKEGDERGKTLTADCVLDARTAAVEMEAVAHTCPGCKEPAMHVVLSWQADEHPTERQQRDAVETVLKNLARDGRDMSEHQWIAVLHKETDQDHLHILINRVHPETGRAVAPEWVDRSLHRAGREIEAAQGWRETPGLMKWSKEQGQAVPTPAVEREAQQAKRKPERAANMESHSYSESLFSYIKSTGAEKELRQILRGDDATWADVQYSLGRHGLQLERAEKGGFTVTDGQNRVKASDALRSLFSGKENRARLERLGAWSPGNLSIAENTYTRHREPQHPEKESVKEIPQQAQEAPREQAQPYRRYDPAAQERRARQAEERTQARAGLWDRYQEEKQAWAKKYSPPDKKWVADRYKQIGADLKSERESIRQRTRPRTQERIVAQSVAAFRAMERRDTLRQSLAEQRKASGPPGWQTWVTDQAQAGDKAAQSQLRSWQYAKSRTPEPVRERLEANDRQAPTRNDGVTAGVQWRRRWFLGGVEYKIDGKAAVIDKGDKIKIVDKGRASDQAIALGVALQAAKRGGNVRIAGSRQFKERAADIAAQRGLFVKFEDRRAQQRYEMQRGQQAQQRSEVRRQKDYEVRRPSVAAVVSRQRDQDKQRGRGWMRF